MLMPEGGVRASVRAFKQVFLKQAVHPVGNTTCYLEACFHFCVENIELRTEIGPFLKRLWPYLCKFIHKVLYTHDFDYLVRYFVQV